MKRKFLFLLSLALAAITHAQVSVPFRNLTGVPSGSTTTAGIVEIATDAEARTGTSGTLVPSVASMRAGVAPLRNALAPAQGLVFDGTAGATVTNVPAVGTGDFSIVVFGEKPTLDEQADICDVAAGQRAELYIAATTGILTWYNGTASALTTTPVVAGKRFMAAVTRSGGFIRSSLDGGAFSANVADTTDYTASIAKIGCNNAGAFPWSGYLRVLIYNRALSAAEVIALYETGVPAAVDYNNASNTAVNTSAWEDVGGGTTLSANTASGFTAVRASGISYIAARPSPSPVYAMGTRFRVTGVLTLNNGKTVKPSVCVDSSPMVNISAAGAFDVTVTQAVAGTTSGVIFTATGDQDWTVSSVVVTRLGLLFASESNPPGNGYQLRSASGQTPPTDLTIPASGVLWALPDTRSNTVRATLTWAGTHEAKSLLGQVALPSNAVITYIVTTASAGSSGSGLTIGSVTSPSLFVAANSYTTAKKVHTLAAQLPAGTATNDLNLVIDPDTSNYTGTIQVAVTYILAQ